MPNINQRKRQDMQHPEFTFDTRGIDKAHGSMRFMVVIGDSAGMAVESMFAKLEDATSHALEIMPFRDGPVHVYSTYHGDCVLTVWPRDARNGGDNHGE